MHDRDRFFYFNPHDFTEYDERHTGFKHSQLKFMLFLLTFVSLLVTELWVINVLGLGDHVLTALAIMVLTVLNIIGAMYLLDMN